MPITKKQKLIYAFITVIITVPAFVIYCLSIENGGILNISLKEVLIYIPVELVLAYLAAVFVGSPLSLKIVFSKIPKNSNHLLIQTAIVLVTVCIMCPLMSFLATILYQGIFPGLVYNSSTFNLGNFFIYFIPIFLQTVVINFPFALISQLFFIQPFVRKVFNFIYS